MTINNKNTIILYLLIFYNKDLLIYFNPVYKIMIFIIKYKKIIN